MSNPYRIQSVTIEGADGRLYEVTATGFTSIGVSGQWDGRIFPFGQVPEAVTWAQEDLFAENTTSKDEAA